MIGHGSKFGRKKEQAFLAYQGCERGVATFYDLPGIPQPSEGRHHLIIELKRPSQNVNSTVISQTKSYAFAVAADERFQNVRTNWTFWALSNKMTEQAQLEAQMEGQPQGVVYQSKADARGSHIRALAAGPLADPARTRLALPFRTARPFLPAALAW